MLSKMLKQMFNEKEQQMLEYMACHYLSSYYEYHQPIQGSTKLLHVPTNISANELARIFKISEEDAKDFFSQLEEKHIGKINIHQCSDSVTINIDNNNSITYGVIEDETENRCDKNTDWSFSFNETTLQCEIIKPTVDEWKNTIIQAVNN